MVACGLAGGFFWRLHLWLSFFKKTSRHPVENSSGRLNKTRVKQLYKETSPHSSQSPGIPSQKENEKISSRHFRCSLLLAVGRKGLFFSSSNTSCSASLSNPCCS